MPTQAPPTVITNPKDALKEIFAEHLRFEKRFADVAWIEEPAPAPEEEKIQISLKISASQNICLDPDKIRQIANPSNYVALVNEAVDFAEAEKFIRKTVDAKHLKIDPETGTIEVTQELIDPARQDHLVELLGGTPQFVPLKVHAVNFAEIEAILSLELEGDETFAAA